MRPGRLAKLRVVVAVSTGALGAALATGTAGEITTTPMARLPLVLIPAFLVPFSTMLHLTALFQARRLSVSEDQQNRPLQPLVGNLRKEPSVAGDVSPRKANHGDHIEPYDRTGS